MEVLRGKAELRNLILNEDVLSEKLELPPWLRIQHASCNRVTVKIPWTQLKSRPVELHVDEIHVTLELCADNADEFRQKRSTNKLVLITLYFIRFLLHSNILVLDQLHMDLETELLKQCLFSSIT
jgi:hypothetical protein